MITSFRHDNEKKIRRRKILGVFLVLALFILVFRTPVEEELAGVFHFVARPFLSMANSVTDSLAGTRSYFSSKRSLLEENVRLQDALDMVAAESYSREVLRSENEALKSVLGRHTARSLLLARVLASPGRAPYDTLIIDVGEHIGVAVGTPVLVDGDFAVGEVTQVFGESAVVTLYSSSGNELPVTVGSSSVPTIAYGVGGGNFRIVLPRGVPVSEGDMIEIPSLAPLFAGVVDAISKQSGGSLQEIYFKWPMNVHTLRFVYLPVSEGARTEVTPAK